jgi:signal transduction histidine kinase/ActR/RegA family two-component response regulator
MAIRVSPIISLLVAGKFIIFGDIEKVSTNYGSQFNYSNNIFAWIMFIYMSALVSVIFALHLRWWLESGLKRYKTHARRIFVLITLIAPPALAFEYIIPTFTNSVAMPLGSALILIPSIAIFASVRINQTFSITTPNVSGYIFRHSIIPTLVLDYENNVGLANRAFDAFYDSGKSVVGENITKILFKDGLVPEQEFFSKSKTYEIVTVETKQGTRTCEMTLSIERDKYGDSLCKVVMLNDATENGHKDRLLNVVNQVSSVLLEPKSSFGEFEVDLHMAMGMIAHAVKVDRMYIWKNYLEGDRVFTSQVYEWSEDVEPQQGNQYTMNIAFDESVPSWLTMLPYGRCVNGIVENMDSTERAALAPQGIISILVVPIFLEDEFWGIIGFDDCVNERIFTENEEIILRSVSKMLANALVRNEMTKDLKETSEKLESALDQANAASKAKSEFLSNMSHEMRTPLNAIFGMTTLGKKAGNTDEKNFALSKIEEASSHLLGVISDVLDMAKIEANKLELFPVEFNFENMVEKAISIVSFRREEKKQALTFNIDEKLPRFVIGDDQRLAQVLTNLLSNAVKFTPEGGRIHLDASLVSEEGSSCIVRVEVADSGIGISNEQAKKLFNAFEQASSGTTREFGGTGLGLVISKRIISLMGGQISIESEEGLGTKVIFTVNVKRSTKNLCSMLDHDVTQNNAIATPDEINEGEFSEKYMLFAEDVEINREILTALLDSSGIKIDCAENGREAVNMIKENPDKYDIVFMDIQMPYMDGLEATRQIRKLDIQNIKALPIIAMTANVFREDIEACEKAGMDAHLGKPLDITKVIQVLRQYLLR